MLRRRIKRNGEAFIVEVSVDDKSATVTDEGESESRLRTTQAISTSDCRTVGGTGLHLWNAP